MRYVKEIKGEIPSLADFTLANNNIKRNKKVTYVGNQSRTSMIHQTLQYNVFQSSIVKKEKKNFLLILRSVSLILGNIYQK